MLPWQEPGKYFQADWFLQLLYKLILGYRHGACHLPRATSHRCPG